MVDLQVLTMVAHQLEGLLVEEYRAASQVELIIIRRLIMLLYIRNTIFLVSLLNEYLLCKIDGGGIAAPGFCPAPNGLADTKEINRINISPTSEPELLRFKITIITYS